MTIFGEPCVFPGEKWSSLIRQARSGSGTYIRRGLHLTSIPHRGTLDLNTRWVQPLLLPASLTRSCRGNEMKSATLLRHLHQSPIQIAIQTPLSFVSDKSSV